MDIKRKGVTAMDERTYTIAIWREQTTHPGRERKLAPGEDYGDLNLDDVELLIGNEAELREDARIPTGAFHSSYLMRRRAVILALFDEN